MIDSNSKVNAITLTYTAQLDLIPRPTKVDTQKIDGLPLKIYEMIRARFSVVDKFKQIRFFKKTILLINTNNFVKIVLNENSEIFVIYVVVLEASESAKMMIYLFQLSQVPTEAA